MKKNTWKRGFWFFLFVLLFIPSYAFCDIYWVSEQTTQGVPGQPDGVKMIKSYVTSYASRVESGREVTIMDLKEEVMYVLDPQKRTYSKMDMKEIGGLPAEAAEMSAEERAMMQNMMKKMAGSMQVTPTNETKKISGYECKKVLVSIMGMSSEYWVSKDVEGYDDLEKMGSKMAQIAEKNPMLQNINVAGMVEKIDGFPVQMVMNVMGGKMVTTLKEMEKRSLDKKLFTVPKGYVLENRR